MEEEEEDQEEEEEEEKREKEEISQEKKKLFVVLPGLFFFFPLKITLENWEKSPWFGKKKKKKKRNLQPRSLSYPDWDIKYTTHPGVYWSAD